jgi:hypothetical protein
MITAKTTALILAMTIVGAATPAAFATPLVGDDNDGGIAVVTTTQQSATNSDDDQNTQANVFAPKVTSEQKVEQNSGTQGSAGVINLGTGPNTSIQTSTQTVSASQSNTVNDNDIQTNNQCALGPSVFSFLSCLNAQADEEDEAEAE